VSFFRIPVYVVGLYVAIADIAALQEWLVRVVDPVATTLVPAERSRLKEVLLDPEHGEEVWNDILKQGGIRMAIRIVPTRNTDFLHLRDGWMRGITNRTAHLAASPSEKLKATNFDDDAFADAVAQFKSIWGGGAGKSVPKGETLLMMKGKDGALEAWHEGKKGGPRMWLGRVDDERVARLIWLGYLGGKNVSSESARQSVVEGVMDFVERPVGTVATQVT